MAFTHEDTGGATAESVGGAGDEDTGHGRILPPKCARTDRRGPAMALGPNCAARAPETRREEVTRKRHLATGDGELRLERLLEGILRVRRS